MKQAFDVTLQAKGPEGAWTFLPLPFDVETVFGSKARVAVAGTINGFPFRNSVMPDGDGTHSMMVGKDLQAGANARAGDLVSVTMWIDDQERTIETPGDLEAALQTNGSAAALFASMTHAQKKDFIDWIASAKQDATRKSRIDKAIGMLASGQKRTR